MTLYRARLLDVPFDPFLHEARDALRFEDHGALLVRDGIIAERGPWGRMRARHPREPLVESGGALLPGFVDIHVHFPQLHVLAGLGQPLLTWLTERALPEEERMAQAQRATEVARDSLQCMAAAGTTSALVFGAHFPEAMDIFFAAAERSGLRVTSGLVIADRGLTPALHTDTERAATQSLDLARRWHGTAQGRLQYAVTPRFSLSSSPALLDACGQMLRDPTAPEGLFFTSHVNENPDEIESVRALHGGRTYVETYADAGLLGPRAVLAHDVHPQPPELALLAAAGTAVAHCPTSNAALGSGLFPLAAHQAAGIPVALGSDVGAGAGYWMLTEGLQALYVQQLLASLHDPSRPALPLTPTHALWLATVAGDRALGGSATGHLGVGSPFDAVLLDPAPGSLCSLALDHAQDDVEILARLLTMAGAHDVQHTWVAGRTVYSNADPPPSDEASPPPPTSPVSRETDSSPRTV